MAKNKIYIPYFISNENFAPAKVFPRIFFYNGTKECDIIKVQYYNTGSTLVTTDTFTAFPYFDHYSGQTTTTSSLSLLFLNEEPVYGTQPPSQSLFDKYWSNYINLLYDPKTRILRCNAVLPFDVYQNVELNDIIQLRSNYYHLRAINDYNLRTGECRLELLGPLLEGSMDNITFFDTTCLTASVISNVTNDTGSRVISFNITGSNCCNNPNELVVKLQYGTGSCPVTASNTIYVTIPNTNPASISYGASLPPGPNCVTMSVANYCFGSDTGSFSFVFSGSLSGSYGNIAVSGSAQKDDCTGAPCYTASFYTTVVPANTYFSTSSQADANNLAIAYLTSVTQSNANLFGSCSYTTRYSTEISASVQKNDCLVCQTGSFVLITLPASHSQTFCDQTEAQTEAQLYFNSISQSEANASGSCSSSSFYNTAISATVYKNNCAFDQTGSFTTVTLAASYSFDSCSQANAQATAQAYFNANSQSWANASGSCSPSFYVNLEYNFQTDVMDTSNYPLSISVISTGSSNPPNENDSKWLTLRFLSSSQSTASLGGGLTYTVSMPTYENAKMWIKVRDKNNNKIHFVGSNNNGTSFMYTGSTSVGGNTFRMLESKPKLYNNYTQSLGLNYDIPFGFVYQATSSIKPVTASYIYTSSATFPSINDAKWKQFNYWTTASVLANSEDLCVIEGVTYKNQDRDVYVSQSNYYYFKWNLNNGSQWTASLVDVYSSTVGNITASIASGSGIVRMAFTNPTASDSNNLYINVQ